MLAPQVTAANSLGYVLWIADDCRPAGDLAVRLEQLLCENYHYKNCRYTRQLQKVAIRTLAADSSRAFTIYQRQMADTGMLAGDVKFSALSRLDNWAEQCCPYR